MLLSGSRLGPYEIVAPLGAGGMGEVYRARDPRMGREVAIKVSAERFSDRFYREVRAVAALNHPNICHIYDVGPNYLVMELIEGPTMADRIKEGALPLEEALAIARQIGDALEAAHEKGIVHRDLKPANIKIKPDGTVKVLDFGLAKMQETAVAAGSPEESPTVAMGTTIAGQILGTAAYMAPEQARGKTVDRRVDIWAFGVVLYEMVVGSRLFEGETISDTLAGVLTKEPDWTRIPAKAQRLVKSCLEKDPATAFHLWTVPLSSDGGSLHAGQPEVFLQTSADERHPVFSPDGRWLAYSSTESGDFQVYVRAFPDKGGKWQVSRGGGVYPTWSRNGRQLFFESRDNRIMVADYTVDGDSFIPDKPRVWSETRLANLGLFKNFDLAPDGKRVVALLPPEREEAQQPRRHVVFVENFLNELCRRVPVK